MDKPKPRPKSVGFTSYYRIQQPMKATEFDIWKLIKRNEGVNTYNMTLRYRSYRDVASKRPRTTGTIHRRRRHGDLDSMSESDGRESVQTNNTDTFDNEHFFKDDYDFDAEEPPEPPLYPHLVRKPGTYAQELYRKACREYGVTRSSHFYKSLTGDKIIMRRQRLGPLGTKACAIALMEILTVHTVDFTDNNLGPKGAEYVAELIRENNFIKHLDLSLNALGGEGVQQLVPVVTKLDTLTSLNLSGNGLGDKDAEDVRPLIEDTHNLKSLNLSHNEFREEGGKILADALLWNDTIDTLDLSWNNLRRKGAIKIAEVLTKNFGLLKLNLSWNGLCLPGCRALGKALEKNSSLQDLDLSSNRINRECLDRLLLSLKKNTAMHTLRIGQNPLRSDDLIVLLIFIQQNPTSGISHIDLKGDTVDETFMQLMSEIQQTRTLEVTYGAKRDADMGIRDDNERALVGEDPLDVFVEFGHIIGVRMMSIFAALQSSADNLLLRVDALSEVLKMLNFPLSDKCTKLLIHRFDRVLALQNVATSPVWEHEATPTEVLTDKMTTAKIKHRLNRLMTKRLIGDAVFRHSVAELKSTILKEGPGNVQQTIVKTVRDKFDLVLESRESLTKEREL